MSKHIELFKQGFDETVSEKIKWKNRPFMAYSPTDDRVLFSSLRVYNPLSMIKYTSNDGNIVVPRSSDLVASTIRNTYEDGLGIISFDHVLTSIGKDAFYNRDSLTSITLPSHLATIGQFAFCGCDALSSITIPASVTRIEVGAFLECRLRKTNYTGDIASWCNIEFEDSISNPIGESRNLYINDREITNLVIPGTAKSIKNYAFWDCRSLTSVVINNGVESIGKAAFYYCTSLTSVTIGDSVTSIGGSAFSGCSSLTSVTIGNSVTSIGEWAFGDCYSLTTIICTAITPPILDSGNSCYKVTAVYVPADSVEDYKTASNWAYYSNVIQPIL